LGRVPRADLSEGTGVIGGLHVQEERLRRLDLTNVLLLRPVSFFENFYDALGLIKLEGINGDSVESDLAVPMIASRDIAREGRNPGNTTPTQFEDFVDELARAYRAA
jgi:hypothetical protein